MKNNKSKNPQEDWIDILISSARIGDFFEELNGSYRTFGGTPTIIFDGLNHGRFIECVKKLYEINPNINKTVSLQNFEKELIQLVRPVIEGKTDRKQIAWGEFERAIKNKPIGKFSIYRDIYGISIDELMAPLKLGPFLLYKFSAHRSILDASAIADQGDFWSEKDRDYLIRVDVLARDGEKAMEIAEAQFETFEKILRYLIDDNKNYEIGIVNYKGPSRKHVFILTDFSAGASYGRDGPLRSVPLNDQYFTNAELGFNRVWDICEKEEKTQMEKRLLLAIEWLGQAFMEKSRSSAFLKAAISLEILFANDERSIISPSILSQISENVALVVGDDLEKRLRIEKDMKRLYGQRSAIVHTGKSDVDLADLYLLFSLAKSTIVSVITKKAFADIHSAESLFCYLKSRKYSCNPIV